MGFNSAFKGLNMFLVSLFSNKCQYSYPCIQLRDYCITLYYDWHFNNVLQIKMRYKFFHASLGGYCMDRDGCRVVKCIV